MRGKQPSSVKDVSIFRGQSTGLVLVMALALAGLALPVQAQEMVTIPKARLEELERKEAELEKLKGDLSKTREQNAQLQKQHEADAAKAARPPPAQPTVTHVSPPLASLLPLKPGETVEALDLANHYRADAAAADRRYRKKRFLLKGEVAAFEKPLLRRDYRLILKTPDREMRLVCDVFPPDTFKAVLTIKNGSELVGQMPDTTRLPIAKVGDTVTVEGECDGLRDGAVVLSGCELKSVR